MGKYVTTKALRALRTTKKFLVLLLSVLSVLVVTPLLSQTHQPIKPSTCAHYHHLEIGVGQNLERV